MRPAGTARDDAGLLRGLAPVIGPAPRLLVLGSFPGGASLAQARYYAHPRNQFWPILSELWGLDLRALTYEERLQQVRERGLGIWDIYVRCRREGSLDSAIEDAELNDLSGLCRRLPALQALAHNGGESARAMRITRALGLPVHRLPSTSPANAAWTMEKLTEIWREALKNALN